MWVPSLARAQIEEGKEKIRVGEKVPGKREMIFIRRHLLRPWSSAALGGP